MLPLVAQHAVILADVDGVISHWSSGAEELFGYRAEDAIGRRVDMVVPEHLRERPLSWIPPRDAQPQVKDLPPICRCGAQTAR